MRNRTKNKWNSPEESPGLVEIIWPLVCRWLASVWWVRGGTEGDVRTVCEECRWRGLKVDAGKNRVMVMNEKEGLNSKVHIDSN